MARRRNPLTAADCIAAIREAGSIQQAAPLLGVSSGIIYSRLKESNIDIDTLEVRPPLAFGPGEELDYQRATIRRALELGLWHIDRFGDIQQYRKDDPWRGQCPNLIQPRVAA